MYALPLLESLLLLSSCRSKVVMLEPLRLLVYLIADILMITWNIDAGKFQWVCTDDLLMHFLNYVGISTAVMMLCRIVYMLSFALWASIAFKVGFHY